MSRIGKKPIDVPDNVKINFSKENVLIVEGPLGRLSQYINPLIQIKQEEGILKFIPQKETIQSKAYHGLYRALVQNMVVGVTKGHKKSLEVRGVGYKAKVDQNILELEVGRSHHVFMAMPEGVEVSTKEERGSAPIIHVSGPDKQLVGQVAAKIQEQRPPEPYKGKGIRYLGAYVRQKVAQRNAK